MPDVSPQERRRLLEDNADHIETGTYFKVLTEDDVHLKREQLAEVSIKMNDLEQEKKDIMDAWKEKYEPEKRIKTQILDNLRTGQEQFNGKQYLIADHDAGEMLIYDEDGVLIRTRKLRPDERQGKIMGISRSDRTGTHD